MDASKKPVDLHHGGVANQSISDSQADGAILMGIERWRPACDAALLSAVRLSLDSLPAGCAVGIGLSAGADSAMLALHAAVAAADTGRSLHCFHVHHGLQTHADAWLKQAHQLAGLLNAEYSSRRVQVSLQGRGMEAAARTARYKALTDMARQAGIAHLLLAHHQDDQAETVLLRLLRGTGPMGLAAMMPVMQRGGLTYHRPWLGQARAVILQAAQRFAELSGWHPVQDPSNHDSRYARAAVRTDLAPVLDVHWPAWRQVLARHAGQAQELRDWAEACAREDWLRLDPRDRDRNFSLAAWRSLAPERQTAVLRYWLQSQDLRMPTQARLDAWLKQLRGVHALGHDRQVQLRHDRHWIVVCKGRVLLAPQASGANSFKTL